MRFPGIGLNRLCRSVGKSPQSYYRLRKRKVQKSVFKAAIIRTVGYIRSLHPGYGLRKLHYCLLQQGIAIGRDSLRRLLKENGLLFVRKRRFYIKTTQSRHKYSLYANLLKTIEVNRPEQVWIADITAIRIGRQAYFLALVADAYSRKIMGWELADKNTGGLACKALLKANAHRVYPNDPLTHHSDRGTQYCCDEYRMLMREMNLTVSTTETGNPRENAIMERTIKTLKYEYGLKSVFKNEKTALQTIQKAIIIYNNFRIHYSCQMLTPAMKHSTLSPPFLL